jgi:hypothetical protein
MTLTFVTSVTHNTSVTPNMCHTVTMTQKSSKMPKIANGVAPLAMPRQWRQRHFMYYKKTKRKRFRDRSATFTTVYVVGWGLSYWHIYTQL